MGPFSNWRERKTSLVPAAVDPATNQDLEVPREGPTLEQTTKSAWERRTPVIACGAGLLADGYLNAAIGPVNTLLGQIYPDQYTSYKTDLLSAITFAGEVVGIIIFGYTADKYSRKWSLFISTIILFVFAALTAGAYGAGGSINGLIAALIAYRFLTGIGIGGEYPAGSVGCAESTGELESGKRNRWFIWFTNLQIDIGFVLAQLVAMIVILATGENHERAAWRIILGIGIVPPLALLPMRWFLKEPEAFEREKMKSTPWLLILRFYWFRMLVVSAIWFIYDFSAFAFGIYSSTITTNLLGNETAQWVSFGWSTLINVFYLPGAMLGSYVSDWIGPKNALITGVTLQAIVGFIMAGVYKYLSEPKNIAAFCVVYGIFLSLGELGPGDNIGLIASKTCATAVRGKYYAFAAGFGKIGAFVGIYVFRSIQDAGGNDPVKRGQYPFWVASSMAFLAAGLALLFIPQIGQDTIDEEDRRFRAFLKQNGYDTSNMGRGEYLEDEASGEEVSPVGTKRD